MYDMTLLPYRHHYEELLMYSVPERPKQAACAPLGCAALAHKPKALKHENVSAGKTQIR